MKISINWMINRKLVMARTDLKENLKLITEENIQLSKECLQKLSKLS